MKLERVKEIMENIRPGVYTTITYACACPVKAEFKKQGIMVVKEVSMTARFKINYFNIKAVKAKRSLNHSDLYKKERVNNFVPLVEHCLYHNTNTDKDYLNVYTIKNSHTKSCYNVFTDQPGPVVKMTKSEMIDAGYIQNNYLKKDRPDMFRIDVRNIISINGEC